MFYREYLKSKRWIKKKRQTKYWHGNRCAVCNSKKVDIHHKTYSCGLGNELPKKQLIPLCRFHHGEVHKYAIISKLSLHKATDKYIRENTKKTKMIWKNMTPFQREQFIGVAL